MPFSYCFTSSVGRFTQSLHDFSCSTDEISFQLDLSTDKFGGDTSWTIINISNGIKVEEGLWYQSNQVYTENRCLPCGFYNFTIHDSFGDGLTIGNDGGYNITIDKKLVKMNSGTSFSSETTVFHGGAQCPDISLAPSSSPTILTCEDDEIAFQLDLSTDTFGGETSWTIINAYTGVMVEQELWYQSNQIYTENRCLPCGLYNFTIHDSFGDGLIMGKNGGYNISIDNELIKMNSGTSFSSETTVFHGGAQCPDISLAPSTAPEVVTCKDNESKFQFDLTTDAYGHETSWTLSKTNDGSIIEHGGNYQSGHSYIVTICLPCGLYNFTIYDGYGDGIFTSGGYSIQVDSTIIKKFAETSFSVNETTLFHGGAQCDKKCEDSNFKMNHLVNGELKGCHWVSKKPKNRCSDPKIASHCPSTCGICELCIDSAMRFFDTRKGKLSSCIAVGRKPAKIATRCAKHGIKKTCPHTCGVC